MRRWALPVIPFVAVFLACGRMAPKESGSAEGKAQQGAASTEKTAERKTSAAKILEVFKPEPVVVAQGTELPLIFETSVSSDTSREGDLVVARLAGDVKVKDRVVIPAGSEVRGQVTIAAGSGRVKGRARLAVNFDRVAVKGKEYGIKTRSIDITAQSTKKRDAAIIGGGAGAGAVIGGIAGGKKGAGIGAAVGAGAGTGTVLATKGKEVRLPAGYQRKIRLTEALTID